MKHVLIVCGDASADRHAEMLVKHLRQRDSSLRISALGGMHLQKSVDKFLYPLVGIGGFGFWEPLTKLPSLWTAFSTVKQLFKEDPPDIVVPIDYYGFNIHVARAAKRVGIPVVYYISPQVWASRPGRIKKLQAVVNKMLVIFPFEVGLYQKANVPVTFVGHPLVEWLPAPGAASPTPLIGLMPGSRVTVMTRHLPLLIETAKLLRADFSTARFVLFCPEEIEKNFYKSFLTETPWIDLETDPTYERRKSLWLAIGVSGTTALENMLLGIPMIIMYKLSWLSYWIAKRLIRVPYVGIPNLLAGRLIVPEFLQDDATPEKLAKAAKMFLSDSAKRAELRETLLSLRTTLQGDGHTSAAKEILATKVQYPS
jgi:lipid-A-disaccharide synthase